jgi:hypothetical protein
MPLFVVVPYRPRCSAPPAVQGRTRWVRVLRIMCLRPEVRRSAHVGSVEAGVSVG